MYVPVSVEVLTTEAGVAAVAVATPRARAHNAESIVCDSGGKREIQKLLLEVLNLLMHPTKFLESASFALLLTTQRSICASLLRV